jgi:hypothetical protein
VAGGSTVSRRWLRATSAALCAGAAVAFLAGCGDESEETFSASRFAECLQSRDAGPSDLLSDTNSGEQSSIRDRLAREAREQNGAVRAFTNTEDPNASSISLLFFRGSNDAQDAATTVENDIESEANRQRERGLEPVKVAPPQVRGNVVILDEPTEAQRRVLDDCLEQSVADA